MKITNTETMNQFIVNYVELLEAFEIFEKKVKSFFNEYAFKLREHPYWGPWLKGNAKWVDGKGLISL